MKKTNKKRLLIIAFGFITLALLALLLIQTNSMSEKIQKIRIESSLKEKVGADYFKNNFRMVKFRAAGRTIPPQNGDKSMFIYTYKLLTFSKENDYTFDITTYKLGKKINFDNLPECTLNQTNGDTRCNFKINYSDAYKIGAEKLQNLSENPISVRYVLKNEGNYWGISILTNGSPDCAPETTYFSINADSGKQTPLEEHKGNYCI